MIVFLIFLLALIARFIISFLPSFDIDMGTWVAWAKMLSESGPAKFYTTGVWNHYLPGYLYVLWIFGNFSASSIPLLIKVSTTLFDIGTSIVLYSLIRKYSLKWATGIAALYLFNPAIIFNTNVWGQVDGVLAFFLLLTVVSLNKWKKINFSAVLLGISVLIKPQAIAIIPVWLFLLTKMKVPVGKIAISVLISLSTFIILSLPFFPNNPIIGPIDLFLKMANDYSYSSLFAFNLWSVFGGWKPDAGHFFGLTLFGWGQIFYLISLIVIFKTSRKKDVYLFSALVLSAFFLFPTRVHERYLLPFFAFLFLSAGVTKSLGLLVVGIGFTLIHLLNLYYVYNYYNPNWLKIPVIQDFLGRSVPFLSLVSLGGFLLLFFEGGISIFLSRFSSGKRLQTRSGSVVTRTENPWIIRHQKGILLVVVFFAIITRLIRLEIPQGHMFDEVYHAFTSQEILKGNNSAWEWWNTPPKGFAYEWSHPPLAKEFMVAGLVVVGNNPLGWRIPGAIVGSLCVILVFLIAWEIFRNTTISILSSLVFSLDTLPQSMSRIGMNDIYFLFFLLSSAWLLLRGRYLLMSLTFGLSLASKWTAVYFLGLVSFIWLKRHLWRDPKKTLLLFVCSTFIPFIIYLFAYLPFFTWGHSTSKFIELQQQMWWYHTGLKATHPYQSPWWSWPLMLRPVWLHVDYLPQATANIYAEGNPFLYWMGAIATIFAIYFALRKKDASLQLLVFSYLLFFVPWAFSPRIMFLYHFLPATPFLAIIVAWFLYFLLQSGHKKLSLIFITLLFISFVIIFPNISGIPLPNNLNRLLFLVPSWK